MAKTYYANTFFVDSADTTDVFADGRFHGETLKLNPIAYAVDGIAQAATVAAEATADGSDATTTQALANALKVKVNAILTSLKTAKLMA